MDNYFENKFFECTFVTYIHIYKYETYIYSIYLAIGCIEFIFNTRQKDLDGCKTVRWVCFNSNE